MRSPELKIPPLALVVVLGALMWVTASTAPTLGFTVPAAPILAAGLALAGLVLVIVGVVSFRKMETTISPQQPEAAARLVVSGIYRRTRNPMYLGMLLALLGWGVFLANLLAIVLAAMFVPVMNRLQIGPEERVLAARFGTAFTAYRSTVRRWL